MNTPLVSVACITYNHENYITQAIEGFLLQKISFPIEIIIHDDASTDNTRKIVGEYAKNNSSLIFPIYQKVNQYSLGNRPFTKYVLPNCKGKYIAICEGDDYWTDKNKLQKQVNFLESHPDCAICFHNVTVSNEDGVNRPWNNRPAEEKKILTLEDLLNGNFIHTCSVMFRRGLFNYFPQWFYKCTMGDWPLHILNAQHGDIGYIDQIMSAYRVHGRGACSSISRTELLNNTINAAEIIKHCLNQKHRKIIINSITRWHLEIVEVLVNGNDFKRASLYARKCLPKFRFHGMTHWKLVIKLVLIGYFPMLFKYLLSVKSVSPEFCTAFAVLTQKKNCASKSIVTGSDSYIKPSSNA